MEPLSEVLLNFIDPLLDGRDDEHTTLSKAKLGQIVWNSCVSDSLNLPIDKEMKRILKMQLVDSPEINKIVNTLTIRKNTLFSHYNNFIFSVELRKKQNGSTALHVISAPVDKIKKQ